MNDKPRKPLRRTPIKRSSKPMRRQAKDTAKENRAISGARAEYVHEKGGSECHEMIGGGSRKKTKMDRRFWLAVGHEEHKVVQYEPKAKQMARKLVQDGEHFDLQAVNDEYRSGGKEWPITFAQIGEYLREAIEDGGF